MITKYSKTTELADIIPARGKVNRVELLDRAIYRFRGSLYKAYLYIVHIKGGDLFLCNSNEETHFENTSEVE